MRTFALFGAKNFDFSKFLVCPHGQGKDGVEPVRTFFRQGEGVNFSRFCADVFYGRPLKFKISHLAMLFVDHGGCERLRVFEPAVNSNLFRIYE